MCRAAVPGQLKLSARSGHRDTGRRAKTPPRTSLSLTSCPRLRLDNPCLRGLRFPLRLGLMFPLHPRSSRSCPSNGSSYSAQRWQPTRPRCHTPSWSWCRRKTAWGSGSGCSPRAHRSLPFRRTPPQGSRPARLPSPLTGTSRIRRWGVCGSLTSPRTRTTSSTCSEAARSAVRASSPSPGASAPPSPRWYLSWYPPWWLLKPSENMRWSVVFPVVSLSTLSLFLRPSLSPMWSNKTLGCSADLKSSEPSSSPVIRAYG